MKTPSTSQKIGLHYQGTPTGAVTGAYLDTLGFDGGHAVFVHHAAAGTTSSVTGIKVQESDASGSGYVDITGADFADIDTSSDNAIYVASLKLRGRKRYLRFAATGGGTADYQLTVVDQLVGPRESNDCDDTYAFEV